MTNRNPRKQVTYTTQGLQKILTDVHDGAVNACIQLVDQAVADGTPAEDIGTFVAANKPKFSPGGSGGGPLL